MLPLAFGCLITVLFKQRNKREVVANNEERKVFTMETQIFMRINEVTKELGVFVPYTYKFIWQMNEELVKT